ncbi:MAG: CDP-diacylglycerol--glycerol-3-phosphate 3-phosphatidyltransferase, partial [Coriobacteriia bacterium]|nr:CDP-diacylglycerol--glycerol-3-phosphate 3-phosphatidyltransferase [Coriobacteriia bacterium]
EGVVIAASNWGKVKTVFQIIAIVLFILKDARFFAAWSVPFDYFSWAVMFAALALTVVSAVEYFYHARDIIDGPWSTLPPDPRGSEKP